MFPTEHIYWCKLLLYSFYLKIVAFNLNLTIQIISQIHSKGKMSVQQWNWVLITFTLNTISSITPCHLDCAVASWLFEKTFCYTWNVMLLKSHWTNQLLLCHLVLSPPLFSLQSNSLHLFLLNQHSQHVRPTWFLWWQQVVTKYPTFVPGSQLQPANPPFCSHKLTCETGP